MVMARLLRILAAVFLSCGVALTILAGSVPAEMDCAALPHWSATTPPVNQRHVFCGEWNSRNNRPAGFHSRPAGQKPATVGNLKITQQPNHQGLYGVRWSYAGHPDRDKFSTMFPDTCRADQVLQSIAYAANHPQACPAGAPRWAICGPNKPPGDVQGYCGASDQTVFTIGFATLKNSGKVNTAFPLME